MKSGVHWWKKLLQLQQKKVKRSDTFLKPAISKLQWKAFPRSWLFRWGDWKNILHSCMQTCMKLWVPETSSSTCSLLHSRERSYEHGILPRVLEIIPRKKWRICVLVDQLSRRCAHLDPSCGFMGQGKDERLCWEQGGDLLERNLSTELSWSSVIWQVLSQGMWQEMLSLWKNNAEKALRSQILVIREPSVWPTEKKNGLAASI